MNKEKNRVKKSFRKTLSIMIPAVFTAMIAKILGFISLNSSPVPMIQDFGKMLTIGLIISFILAVLFLMPILYIRDHNFSDDKSEEKKQEKVKKESKADKIIDWLTEKTVKLRWLIVGIAIVIAAIGIWIDLDAEAETNMENFMPQDTQALKDIHQLRDIVGTTEQVSIVYQGDNILSNETIAWVDDIAEIIKEEFPEVIVETKSITSIVKQMNDGKLSHGEELIDQIADMPEGQRKLFLNEDETKGVITVGIKSLETQDLSVFIDDITSYVEENKLNALDATITGKAVLDVEMMEGLTTGRYEMTLLGMGLVFLSLLLIYRHPVKAFIPLLPIIFIVGWSGLAMYLLGFDYTPLTATLGALIIGIGTQYTVLVMSRYYEEKDKGMTGLDALKTTNKSIGKAIFASGVTTIGGFSALIISNFVILSNFGLMTLINISLALISTMIVMPAILIILERFVKIKEDGKEEGLVS